MPSRIRDISKIMNKKLLFKIKQPSNARRRQGLSLAHKILFYLPECRQLELGIYKKQYIDSPQVFWKLSTVIFVA
jgi:hypothetical protein